VVHDLWCMVTGQRTTLKPEEIALQLISVFSEATQRRADGTKVSMKLFDFYIKDLQSRLEQNG
jgi:hypothetical protein